MNEEIYQKHTGNDCLHLQERENQENKERHCLTAGEQSIEGPSNHNSFLFQHGNGPCSQTGEPILKSNLGE